MALPSDTDDTLSCPHAETCGGCPLIHLSYGEQLAWKRAKVMGAKDRFPELTSLEVREVIPAHPYSAYRTRAKLMVAPSGGVGLFAKDGDHEVVDSPDCKVLAPALRETAAVLRRAIGEDERGKGAPLSPYGGQRGGALRALDLREVVAGGASRVLVTLIMQRELAPTKDALQKTALRLMQHCKLIAGFAVSFHEGETPQVLGTLPIPLAGETEAADEIGGVRHMATYGSFVQAHRGQAAAMHEAIRRALPRPDKTENAPRVLDLYGGSGAIALSLAKHGAKVTVVESFGPAASRVREAGTRLEGGGAVLAIHADVAVGLRELHAKREKFDAVVMNPPRRGVSPEVRELLASVEPLRVIYVSCDPETLSRDLAHLCELGYRASLVQPFDMIAQTEEVETLVVLEREAPPPPTVLFEDEQILVVAKSGYEAAISTKSASLTTRVRERLPTAAPLYRLEHGTSGVVVFVKSREKQDLWTTALHGPGAATKFVALARGITHQKGTLRNHDKGGKDTKFRRLSVLAGHSVIETSGAALVSLPLRKQLGAIGHPVLGDDHGHEPSNRFAEERYALDRTFVHLSHVELLHPITNEKIAFVAPLPGDLATVLSRMGGDELLAKLRDSSTKSGSLQAPHTEE